METKVLDTAEKYFKVATKEAAESSEVIGATFGMFMRFHSSTAQEFLSSFSKGTFIVGLYLSTFCKEDCEDCVIKNQKSLKFIRMIQDKNPQHKWIESPSWHTKSICFKKKDGYTALIGSRNLGDSSWDDIAILVGGSYAKNIYNHTKKAIKERS